MNQLAATTIDVTPSGSYSSAPVRFSMPAQVRNPVRQTAMARELRKQYRAMGGYRRHGGNSGGAYDGARWERTDRGWLPPSASGDLALRSARTMLITRSRDLVRNEPYAAAAIGRIVENVVGDEGIQMESAVRLDGELIAENMLIDEAFERWAENEADAEGELSWWEMQALVCGEWAEAGNILLLRCASPERNRLLPLCYQVLESEQLDVSRDRPAAQGMNRIKGGIEFDDRGRRVAYHIFRDHPHDVTPMRSWVSERIEANRIIHCYKKSRPSMTQGAPWLAPILRVMRNFNGYTDSEMESAHAAAKFAVAIMRANGGGTGLNLGDDDDLGCDVDDDATVQNLQELYGAVIADLEQGDDIKHIQANRPNPTAEPWIQLILNSMANGIGMTYLGLTGDVRRASYSSSRFSQLIDKKFWRPLQKRFARGTALPVRYEFLRQLAAYERVDGFRPQQVNANPYLWMQTKFCGPGWEEIDKPKEVAGDVAAVRAGFKTFQDACAERGGKWRANILAKREAMKFAEENEVELTCFDPEPESVAQAAVNSVDQETNTADDD
jgi:lambda family phage portal protein